MGQALVGHFGGLNPLCPDYVFNVVRGELVPGRFGTVQHEVELGDDGEPRQSGSDAVVASVGTILQTLGTAFARLELANGALGLRVDGFRADPADLDRLVAATGAIADALAEVARPWCISSSQMGWRAAGPATTAPGVSASPSSPSGP